MDRLESQIQTLNVGEVLVIGDLNARLGELQSTGVDGRTRVRKSKDKLVNNNGKMILNMCEIYEMDIMNGTTTSDTTGEYTFAKRNVNSVIDLCMAGGEWKNRITDLKVGEQLMSDHMPLDVTATYQIDVQPAQKEELNNRIIWNHFDTEKYKDIVVKVMVENEECEELIVEQRIERIASIIWNSVSRRRKRVIRKKDRTY